MSENVKENVQKKSWFHGMKAEFKKVIWPDKKEITKNTIAVVVTSVILALVIAGFDAIVKMFVSFLSNL